jgi:putative transposase
MSTRVIQLVPDEFYHVYNRGTDKRVIFLDTADYNRFVELLYLSNSEYKVKVRDIKKTKKSVYEFDRGKPLVAIGAYCLMPNHFHMLITPLVENGISIFMEKIGTSYSMYFNKRYVRTGSLFQGTFKSSHATSDEYLKYLYAYIHLNPVKLIDPTWKEEGIKNQDEAFSFAINYKYSSLPDYLQVFREENIIINPNPFPEYFPSGKDMKKELLEWLNFKNLFEPEKTQGTPGEGSY